VAGRSSGSMPVTPKIRSLSSEGSEDTRLDYPIGEPMLAFGDDWPTR
jgi:hypothetical protein